MCCHGGQSLTESLFPILVLNTRMISIVNAALLPCVRALPVCRNMVDYSDCAPVILLWGFKEMHTNHHGHSIVSVYTKKREVVTVELWWMLHSFFTLNIITAVFLSLHWWLWKSEQEASSNTQRRIHCSKNCCIFLFTLLTLFSCFWSITQISVRVSFLLEEYWTV